MMAWIQAATKRANALSSGAAVAADAVVSRERAPGRGRRAPRRIENEACSPRGPKVMHHCLIASMIGMIRGATRGMRMRLKGP